MQHKVNLVICQVGKHDKKNICLNVGVAVHSVAEGATSTASEMLEHRNAKVTTAPKVIISVIMEGPLVCSAA